MELVPYRHAGTEPSRNVLIHTGQPQAFPAEADGQAGPCTAQVGHGVQGFPRQHGQLHELSGEIEQLRVMAWQEETEHRTHTKFVPFVSAGEYGGASGREEQWHAGRGHDSLQQRALPQGDQRRWEQSGTEDVGISDGGSRPHAQSLAH